jgi:thymidylate synthase (FAD)
MEKRFDVLDHGYLQLIETWGSDERIIEAARMSTGKGFEGWGPIHTAECGAGMELGNKGRLINFYKNAERLVECVCPGGPKSGDEKLLRYLWEHKHATPFEMAGFVIEVQAPIMVFREWHRHRTQSYNEMSARYTPLPDLNYVPTVERLLLNSKTNKQAGTIKGAAELDEASAQSYREQLIHMYGFQEGLYQKALAMGVPKELARVHLPVGRYSRMRAAANLRNWLAFLTLRMDKAAQWEIRQYANTVGALIREKFPRTWELFVGNV